MNIKKFLVVIAFVLVGILVYTGNTNSNTKTESYLEERIAREGFSKLAKTTFKASKFTFKKINNIVNVSKEQEEKIEITSEEEHIEEPVQEELIYGDSGRLIIEDVGISVPLYLSVCNGELHQYYVDMPDCACIFDNRDEGSLSLGISDHNYQGFDGLYNVIPGMVAKILYPDGTESDYVCTYVDRNATNDEKHIIDSQGRWVAYLNPEILYMYTCNSEGWWSVTVALWMPC